jgi:hypothetical protein
VIPVTVYRTGRSWWRRPWQGEPTDASVITWPCAITAFTRRRCQRRTERQYELLTRGWIRPPVSLTRGQ